MAGEAGVPNWKDYTLRELVEYYLGFKNRLSKESLLFASLRAALVGGSLDDNDIYAKHRHFSEPQTKVKSVLNRSSNRGHK